VRLAVISDIHGNMEAFQAVLADIAVSRVDQIISLGDNIGYGPDSEQVIALVREMRIPSVYGNHELVVKKPRFFNWFNPKVQISLQKTFAQLSEESISHIQEMQPALVRHGCRFVHGFPRRSALLYLFQMSEAQIVKRFTKFEERLCFVGHTHTVGLIRVTETSVAALRFQEGETLLDPSHRYLINAGSVGQPRDGDNRAKYVIWDRDGDFLDLRCVPYDIDTVVEKILEAGYPESFALRLR